MTMNWPCHEGALNPVFIRTDPWHFRGVSSADPSHDRRILERRFAYGRLYFTLLEHSVTAVDFLYIRTTTLSQSYFIFCLSVEHI